MKLSFKTITEIEQLKKGPSIETSEDDLNQIRKSLKEHGFVSPIIIQNDTIIDGNTRVALAKELGITIIPTIEIDSILDPELVSLILNLARRHMSINQKVEIIAKLIELAKQKKIETKVEKYKDQRGVNATVASIAGVSSATVAKVKKIIQVDPEKIKKISSNEISLEKAYNEVKEKASKNEQRFKEMAKQNAETNELVNEIKQVYKQILDILYSKDSLITISNASKLILFASIVIKKMLPYLNQLPTPDKSKIYNSLSELNSEINKYICECEEEVI